MSWFTKPQKIYLDLVASWLRSEIAKLNHVLMSIEESHNYHDPFINESIKTAEHELRRIRKFIESS